MFVVAANAHFVFCLWAEYNHFRLWVTSRSENWFFSRTHNTNWKNNVPKSGYARRIVAYTGLRKLVHTLMITAQHQHRWCWWVPSNPLHFPLLVFISMIVRSSRTLCIAIYTKSIRTTTIDAYTCIQKAVLRSLNVRNADVSWIPLHKSDSIACSAWRDSIRTWSHAAYVSNNLCLATDWSEFRHNSVVRPIWSIGRVHTYNRWS